MGKEKPAVGKYYHDEYKRTLKVCQECKESVESTGVKVKPLMKISFAYNKHFYNKYLFDLILTSYRKWEHLFY